MQRNITKIVIAMFISVCLASCGSLIKPSVTTGIAQLEKGNYKLDQTHVSVLFKINHMGLSTFVGRFNKVDASLQFDPANIAAAKLSAVIDVASLDANNPDLEQTLRGSSWLDTEKYPQAFFKTTSVSVLDPNSAVFAGELTLHGVTAPMDLTVTFHGGANNMLTGFYTLGFSATSAFNRSTYGIDYLVPAIGDQVAIEVFAEFQQQ
ncbi:MAG: ycel4 [Cellvibrio sp.]|nr:ycel4 [Cellvibrio sp.]